VAAAPPRHHLPPRCDRVAHPELGEAATPVPDLVGWQPLLTLDRHLAPPHVAPHALPPRPAPAKPALTALRHLIPACLQHSGQPAVLVPQPTVSRLDDDVLRHGDSSLGEPPRSKPDAEDELPDGGAREQWMMLLVRGSAALLAPCPAGAALAPEPRTIIAADARNFPAGCRTCLDRTMYAFGMDFGWSVDG